MPQSAVLFLAGGSGKRMQDSCSDKTLAPLKNIPAISYSIQAFIDSQVSNHFIFVYRDHEQQGKIQSILKNKTNLPKFDFVKGGTERQNSVLNGLKAIPSNIEYVFIHDCARPLIRPEQLKQLQDATLTHGAAVLCKPVTDTIKRVSKPNLQPAQNLEDLDRQTLTAMETPQAFKVKEILKAYEQIDAKNLSITDDAAAYDLLDKPIYLLNNPHPNPKITTPNDLAYIDFLLSQNSSQN